MGIWGRIVPMKYDGSWTRCTFERVNHHSRIRIILNHLGESVTSAIAVGWMFSSQFRICIGFIVRTQFPAALSLAHLYKTRVLYSAPTLQDPFSYAYFLECVSLTLVVLSYQHCESKRCRQSSGNKKSANSPACLVSYLGLILDLRFWESGDEQRKGTRNCIRFCPRSI